MPSYTETAAIYACTYVMHEELGNIEAAAKIEHEVLETYGMVDAATWQELLAEERHGRELDRQAVERLIASYKD